MDAENPILSETHEGLQSFGEMDWYECPVLVPVHLANTDYVTCQ